ncbi:dTDP-4-dehydrorhamnose 3,5-epimerase [Pontibacter liquoris]|uniref:dTDP-4-dehydrorhamnose 3,5-epimerase n=1 Tax=Pontibacter liquoris TaxID=2905677 RepID=UPI001FA7C12C|nr:dTDP-4-dehydrorhamnose 3,5-epimerase [Pontibacter liquoris]
MELITTPLKDCFVIKPAVFDDPRGYFFESFNELRFNELTGTNTHFVQDNQSFSSYGVLRGLHFQKGAHAQAKLVRVLQGEVLDVAVDLRKESPTFGQHFTVVLSAQNKLQLFIPRGFAHGFVVLSQEAEFFYKCDNYYHKEAEGGILYNDADLGIDWQLPAQDIQVSEKDKLNLSLNQVLEAVYE